MKQPENIHLDIIIDTMHHFEGMNGVESSEDYQNIMQYIIEECGRRLENSKQLEDSEPKHTYIKGTSTQQTGGGCMVDFVELKNGNVVGISDDCVVLYKSKDWWEGGTESKALYFDEIGD